MVVGVLVAIPGVLGLAAGVWHVVTSPSITVPGTRQLDLGTGTYVVYERTDFDNATTMSSDQLVVTGPDNRRIAVRQSTRRETIDSRGDHYADALEFDTPRSGKYSLRFRTPAGAVLVQRPLVNQLVRGLPWLLATFLGSAIWLLGAGLLILGVVRRDQVKRAARVASRSTSPSTGAAPANWFADPRGEHRLRYWDGHQWTDHTAE